MRLLSSIIALCLFTTIAICQVPFVTEWKITSAGETLVIPTKTNYTYSYDVDWDNDGIYDDIGVTGDASHVYSLPGVYKVNIRDTFPSIYLNGGLSASKLQKILQWGDIEWLSMQNAFKGASGMTYHATDTIDLSQVTSLNGMFYDCSSLNQPLGYWNTSQITTMVETFSGATAFNQDLSNWEVHNVTTMERMFYQATAFDQSLGDWEIRIVEEMDDMLTQCGMSVANYDATLIGWEEFGSGQGALISGAYIGANDLEYCNSITARNILIDSFQWEIVGDDQNCPFITTWRTTSIDESIIIVTNPDYSYSYDIDWENDGIIDDVGVTGDISHSYNVADDYQVAIYGDFPHFLSKPSNVIYNTQLININQWGSIEWQSMTNSFRGSSNLEYSAMDIPNLSQVDNLDLTFRSCSKFNGDIGDWEVGSITSMQETFRGAVMFNQNIEDWDVSNVTDMSGMFRNAEIYNHSIDNWNVLGVTDMGAMFADASSFNQAFTSWETDSVRTMRQMFSRATVFNHELNHWNTQKVTDMASMFLFAQDFNKPLDLWQTDSVTTMADMFHGADSFNQSLNSWNTEKVEGMREMFREATVFNGDIGNWNTMSVINMNRMFYKAVAFNQSLDAWEIHNVVDMDDMLDSSDLSITHYDETLISWASQTVSSDVTLGVAGLAYCNGAVARQSLIGEGWMIDGDVEDCSGSGPCAILVTNTYVGPSVGTWNNAAHWSEGRVPDGCDQVVIGTGKTVSLTDDGICATLEIGAGATFEVDGFTLSVEPSE